ncbi:MULTISPECIES: hypothetical protein [unclassified Acidiplasma]|uniref:hypothetical protein n=1 Tax=unclassified Acidiplasma TaxID=2641301 RepID=UPI0005E10AB0|nr:MULTISPECIES: hypothetical protein [unclassified Acidiplasma]KJE48559.1 hypothetical protein TZ01_07770 [Acidiplasma sp. MBA-1]WMT55290.1 MAG: hypothetical protein RE470_01260 [Acidiplasma sp.]
MKSDKLDSFKKLLYISMGIALILSIAFFGLGFIVKPYASKYQDIVIGAINSIILVVGFFRIRLANSDTEIGRMASQHLWMVFSLSTAVLSLLFGIYFYPGSILIKDISITIVSLISIVTLIAVLDSAFNKIPIFD